MGENETASRGRWKVDESRGCPDRVSPELVMDEAPD